MKLKKMLGIISIVIVVVFSMMLTTSYAWYAFDNASTVFEGMTNNDDIIVSYQKGEYINATTAIPISSEQVDMYSEKNNFNIVVKNNAKDSEMLVSISLVEISIDGSLQKPSFKIELYHQSDKIAGFGGDDIGTSGATTKKLADVILDNDVTNNFELRLYILDDGTNQTTMENKTFQAKIQVNVISRLKNSLNDYSDPDISISSVTIDGEASDYIPTEGYYSMSATCSKGSNLTWEPLSKTITYNSGSYINDDCSLAFTSSTDYPLLSEMPEGSYVKYVGSNGCDGIHCEGYNANYKSDTDMGYCSGSGYKFHVNGWRIAYKENDSAYLISAGAPECLATYSYNKSISTTVQDLSTNYYYGSGYEYDEDNGIFSLIGITSTVLAWNSNYESIIANTPYTCMSTSSTGTCKTLYEVVEYNSSNNGNVYLHNNYEHCVDDESLHISNLNKEALKYCNEKYINGGECNETTSWAMNAIDFQKIIGRELSSSSCYGSDFSGVISCGYTNDIIDNGSYYHFASDIGLSESNETLGFYAWQANNRRIGYTTSSNYYGIRPVLYLDNSVVVTGGAGTYNDPFLIDILD